uniref:Coiled-coil domain-containing protein, putative n=1 Tax=Arundo donax TaxID=35708 RepID=A0A0A9FDT0_ARUDO
MLKMQRHCCFQQMKIGTSLWILCIGLNTRKRIFGRRKKLSQF